MSATGRSIDGFTLLEVLVVTTILGLVMVGVGLYAPGLDRRLTLDRSASTVAGLLKDARAHAISEHRTTTVSFNAEERQFTSSERMNAYVLPPRLSAEVTGVRSLRPGSKTDLLFLADGSSSGGILRLTDGDSQAVIAVDWLSGRISDAGS